jgi:hypothetical protein
MSPSPKEDPKGGKIKEKKQYILETSILVCVT